MQLTWRLAALITLGSALLTGVLVRHVSNPDVTLAPEVIAKRVSPQPLASSREFGASALNVVADDAAPRSGAKFEGLRFEGSSSERASLALDTVESTSARALLSLAERLTRLSTTVVMGRVERTLAAAEGPAGQPGIHTLVELSVARVLRGAAGSTLSFWVHGGKLDGRIRTVSHQARYEVGEELVMFLSQLGSEQRDVNSSRTEASAQLAPTRLGSALWPTEMALGKWRIDRALGAVYAGPTTRPSARVPLEAVAAHVSAQFAAEPGAATTALTFPGARP